MGFVASFSYRDHCVSGSLWCGPASSRSTSRPWAASSLATTGPPPPAPITITSRMGCLLGLAVSPVVTLELVPAVGRGRTAERVSRQVPAHRPAGGHAPLPVQDGPLAEREQHGEGDQDPAEQGNGT